MKRDSNKWKRAIQQFFPFKLSCDRRRDPQVPRDAVYPQPSVFRSRRNAAVAAALHDVTKQEPKKRERTFHKRVCPFQEQTAECVVKVESYCVIVVF